jgi:hypothetical protein
MKTASTTTKERDGGGGARLRFSAPHVPSPNDAPQSGQKSPWEIGLDYYDQRDSYTRNGRIDSSGYALGSSVHPEDGSYAYLRELPPRRPHATPTNSLYEREAWPWLNYHASDADPTFPTLPSQHPGRPESLWSRFAHGVRSALLRVAHPERAIDAPEDRRIERDIAEAFSIREDLDSTDIEIIVRREEVVLEGTVVDQRERRLAGQTASGIRGVRAVHNRLAIRREDPPDANVVMVVPLSLLGV